ncbi:E3 ubiquitin-protein ligase PRT6 isoform X3 [Syzygium oleosum]|uniref:E3 ubiquitin-protein ligase PRT6 isoform X3 n=1 Tax=Syzygium oleosum TaxID=219896 RepID=UPI0024BACA47|nr:E3 ubiquitin-protein ligase PRT6 isoform X3 [Syzygium oleosum]
MDMDTDRPPEDSNLGPRDRILERLAQSEVPPEYLCNFESGVVSFLKDNESWTPQLVSAILPLDEELTEIHQKLQTGSEDVPEENDMRKRFRESMVWLQWLMFKDEPAYVLEYLLDIDVGQRGVCGAVWGIDDIAYRCRTCENDPTCAICVPCFENGNHEDHDYSMIYTGGGCCDCGDATAWRREGFCSKHKGAEQIQPLPQEIAHSAGPVLDALFVFWKNKLLSAESSTQEDSRASDLAAECSQVANELTLVIAEMLLEFCKHSESLLSFASIRIFSSAGLLEILVRGESFLSDEVVKKLYELLLKLLAEPLFKYEFAKAFLSYYPVVVEEAIKECNDDVSKKHAVSTFSVQIFTVPPLTPRLVKEMNLLEMLFGCLGDIFTSCAGEDGRLQVTKWQNLYNTTIRVAEDIRFVVSHVVVQKYLTNEKRDILRTWMRLLNFVQGMNPLRRETGILIEEEIDDTHFPFGLCYSIASTHSLLVDGASSDEPAKETIDTTGIDEMDMDDGESLRHAKVVRLSHESSACSTSGRSKASASGSKAAEVDTIKSSHPSVPLSITWLINECLKAIENWLSVDKTSRATVIDLSQSNSSIATSHFSALKKTILRIRKGKYIFGRLGSPSDQQGRLNHGDLPNASVDNGEDADTESKSIPVGESDVANASVASDNCAMEGDYASEVGALRVLSLQDWPNIVYDVSSQDISVHIPLHRLLSLLLLKALKIWDGDTTASNEKAAAFAYQPSVPYSNFFKCLLGLCSPVGFSALVMEHPLRISVFCAEVRAGMWKKNGDAALVSRELYRSARWSEQGLELDLFLMQFCAAVAPADLFVSRIIERFGLLSYLSLKPARDSEYEPVLVEEMLTLIIQIVKERRFCGQTIAESLRRELVYKLATGDATRSQLVKSLPRDLAKFEGLQEILDTIASYSNPSGLNQGTYSLRWPCWKELDLYHPRWNSRELQLAEERYARFCSVSALTAQLPRWTYIYAPLRGIAGIATCRVTLQFIRSVLFYAVFSDKACDSRAPDGVLIVALHLLSLAVDICFQQRESGDRTWLNVDQNSMLSFVAEEINEGLSYGVGKLSLLSLLVLLMMLHKKERVGNQTDAYGSNLSHMIESLLKRIAEIDPYCMNELQQLAPEVFNQVPQSVLDSGNGSSGSPSNEGKHRAKARERQAAIMARMRAEQSKFLASISTDEGLSSAEEATRSAAVSESRESVQDVCSLCHDSNPENPLSFLIFLQKSRLLSLVERGPPSWDMVQRPEKETMQIEKNKESEQSGVEVTAASRSEVDPPSKLVQLVRNTINKFMHNAQPSEVNAFMEFIRAGFPLLRNLEVPQMSKDKKESTVYMFETLEEDMYRMVRRGVHNNAHLLESVEGDKNISTSQEVAGDFEDDETVLLAKYIACLSGDRAKDPSASEHLHIDETSVENAKQGLAYDGFGPDDCDGIFLSSCGHAVHQGCLERYLSSLKERHTRRIIFEGGHIVNLDKGEFLCPVCRRLANSILPALPGVGQMLWKQSASSFPNSSQCPWPGASSDTTSLHLPEALCLLQSAADLVKKGELFKAFPLHSNSSLRSKLELLCDLLSKLYFPGQQKRSSRTAKATCSVIMWDTLRYSLISTEISARSGRTSLTPNLSLSALFKEISSAGKFVFSLFLRAIQSMRTKDTLDVLQRFRGIKLFADSICFGISTDRPFSPDGKEGSMLCTLEDFKGESLHPDLHFWKRAADPVLAHDPFSSLMWVLFCLPCPFLLCEESLLSLVHLFYIVSITQAIISFCGKHRDSSVELNEIQTLEKMFKIPSIDKIYKDEKLRFFVLRWIRHLCNEAQLSRITCIARCVPAVPFKLMQLPYLYQDLLQRYIKQQCHYCNTVIEEPALCLLCGRICSPSWKSCCRKSGCQSHAFACGAGIGVFLLIRRTMILFQRSARQSVWPSPYLDAFGEEDNDLHRGKPLYLNEERYAALTYMVASHGLDRSTKVLRQTSVGALFF